jgi:hypothetical protein
MATLNQGCCSPFPTAVNIVVFHYSSRRGWTRLKRAMIASSGKQRGNETSQTIDLQKFTDEEDCLSGNHSFCFQIYVCCNTSTYTVFREREIFYY